MPHASRTITRQPPRTPRAGPRSKRDQILDVATDYFGRYGYDETKWADVAAAVGIGSTALYHYFESKQHCLYEIMSRAVASTRERFDHIIIDCPPGMGLLSRNAVVAADNFLVPVVPHFLAIEGLENLVQAVTRLDFR